MRYLVLFVAAIWLAIAIAAAYAPASVPEWLAIETIGPHIRVLALLPLVFGLILVVASATLRLRIYLRVMGILAIIKGVAFLVLPMSVIQPFFAWYIAMPVWAMRVWALMSIALAIPVAVTAIIALFEEDIL